MAETSPKKSFLHHLVDAVKNPSTILTGATKSPWLAAIAVVFLLQPLISTTIDLFREYRNVKQSLDPSTRPVTKAELVLINEKIDLIYNKLIERGLNELHGVAANSRATSKALKAPAPSSAVDVKTKGHSDKTVESVPMDTTPPPPPPLATNDEPLLAEAPGYLAEPTEQNTIGNINRRLWVLQQQLDREYVEKKK
jgi:hypothetical protein